MFSQFSVRIFTSGFVVLFFASSAWAISSPTSSPSPTPTATPIPMVNTDLGEVFISIDPTEGCDTDTNYFAGATISGTEETCGAQTNQSNPDQVIEDTKMRCCLGTEDDPQADERTYTYTTTLDNCHGTGVKYLALTCKFVACQFADFSCEQANSRCMEQLKDSLDDLIDAAWLRALAKRTLTCDTIECGMSGESCFAFLSDRELQF